MKTSKDEFHTDGISESPSLKGWARFKKGRQGGGYKVMTLFSSKRLKMDLILFLMPEGSELPEHTDPCARPGYEHHRANLILMAPKSGGITTVCDHESVRSFSLGKRLVAYKFRPDKLRHGVTKVEKGKRVALSLGWLKKAG